MLSRRHIGVHHTTFKATTLQKELTTTVNKNNNNQNQKELYNAAPILSSSCTGIWRKYCDIFTKFSVLD